RPRGQGRQRRILGPRYGDRRDRHADPARARGTDEIATLIRHEHGAVSSVLRDGFDKPLLFWRPWPLGLLALIRRRVRARRTRLTGTARSVGRDAFARTLASWR